MPQIFCFGDSITYGAWDDQQAGWSTRLRTHLDQRTTTEADFYALIYNLGIPGENTDSLVTRFLPETTTRIGKKEKEEAVFIFAFGANDSCFIPSQGEFKVPKERYIENLRSTFTEAKKFSSKLMALNITPVIDELNAVRPGLDKSRLNTYVEGYNRALSELCAREGVDLIDIYGAYMTAGHIDLFSQDGLHPNARGHEIIFTLVRDFLEKEWLSQKA